MSLKELQSVWEEFGKRDPLWAVLTFPSKKGGQWDIDEFFRTGQKEIADVMAQVKPSVFDIPKRKALDFGCGAGRLTQALADIFEQVIGVDISPSMIEQAQRLNRRGDKCRFLVNDREDLSVFSDGEFDFVYSSITLQHIDPLYSRTYIREMLRALRPGGMLVFQLPERPLRPMNRLWYRWARRRWYRRERRKAGDIIMEMHGLPRREVLGIIDRGGGKLYSIQANHAAGRKWLAWTYYVHKPRYDLRLSAVGLPKVFRETEMTALRVRVENRSPDASGGLLDDPAVRVGAKLYPAKPLISIYPRREFRADLPLPLPAGGSAETEIMLDISGFPPGAYRLFLDLVHERKCWFSEMGFPPVIMPIRIVRGKLPEEISVSR